MRCTRESVSGEQNTTVTYRVEVMTLWRAGWHTARNGLPLKAAKMVRAAFRASGAAARIIKETTTVVRKVVR